MAALTNMMNGDRFPSNGAVRDVHLTSIRDNQSLATNVHNPPLALPSLYRLALVCGITIPHGSRPKRSLRSCRNAEATQTAVSSSMNS